MHVNAKHTLSVIIRGKLRKSEKKAIVNLQIIIKKSKLWGFFKQFLENRFRYQEKQLYLQNRIKVK